MQATPIAIRMRAAPAPAPAQKTAPAQKPTAITAIHGSTG